MKFKVGDTVKCIRGTVTSKTLIEGNLYVIIDISNSRNEVQIVGEEGVKLWWYNDRFELYTKDMDKKQQYLELQKKFLELTKLKVGDKVIVTNTAKPYQHGWSSLWHEGLNNFVGKTSTITDINGYGIQLQMGCSSYNFPYFVIEKLEYELPKPIKLPSNEYVVEFEYEGDIKVGCQSIDYNTLKAIYDTATTVMENTKTK
jgi:hypothetical protein